MQKNARRIYIAFEGKLIGTPFMIRAVCETLNKMPQEIIDYIKILKKERCQLQGTSDPSVDRIRILA